MPVRLHLDRLLVQRRMSLAELADRTGLGIFREKAWRCTDPQAEGIAELACYLVNADCTYRMVSRGIVLQCILIDVSEAGVA